MLKQRLAAAEVKVPPIPLGDDPSGTAGQKTLRDAPVAIKRRRRFAAFLVTFLAVDSVVCCAPEGRPVG